MAVSDLELKEHDKLMKSILFPKILELKESLDLQLSPLSSNAKKLGICNELPNIWTTINNKYIELSRQFEKAGLSIYSSKIEDFGPLNLNTATQNILGSAILMDLANFKINLSEMNVDLDISHTQNPFKRIFNKLSKKPINQDKLIENIKHNISHYLQLDDDIFRYELNETTIVRAVAFFFTDSGYSKETMIEIANNICKDLTQLGLGSVNSSLMESVANQENEHNDFLESLKVSNQTDNSKPFDSNPLPTKKPSNYER